MKIYLPHIHYTIFVRKFRKTPKGLYRALAYTERLDSNSCALYLSGKDKAGDLAHELVHVLQFICEARNIDFVQEQEHMGYIMHYLMGKVRGHEYA